MNAEEEGVVRPVMVESSAGVIEVTSEAAEEGTVVVVGPIPGQRRHVEVELVRAAAA